MGTLKQKPVTYSKRHFEKTGKNWKDIFYPKKIFLDDVTLHIVANMLAKVFFLRKNAFLFKKRKHTDPWSHTIEGQIIFQIWKLSDHPIDEQEQELLLRIEYYFYESSITFYWKRLQYPSDFPSVENSCKSAQFLHPSKKKLKWHHQNGNPSLGRSETLDVCLRLRLYLTFYKDGRASSTNAPSITGSHCNKNL